jgi:hypothetical protein
MDRHEVLTEVQRRFADADPELTNGFAEHAPMGAEALLTLGVEPSAVATWARRREPVALPASSPVRTARDAIAAELVDDEWTAVLVRHARPLLDRLDAHLFHGLIRTAHAVRALRTNDSPAARGELALALAGWTAWASKASSQPTDVDLPDPLAHVLEMARRGAAAFTSTPSIFTLHAVTAPMDYLLIAEHLDAVSHATAAAVFTRTHARHAAPPKRHDTRPAPTPLQLSGLAQRWDAHPAKLVEAAVRGHGLTGDAAFGDAVAAMVS